MKADKPKPVVAAAKETTDWIEDLLQRAQPRDASVVPNIQDVLGWLLRASVPTRRGRFGLRP